jgi:hypothetical protein
MFKRLLWIKNMHLRDEDPAKTFCGQAADVHVDQAPLRSA